MTINTTTGEIVNSFHELETIIENGLHTFVEVGNALTEIRDRDLYQTSHRTFEDYCSDRWGFSDSRARQLIGAAATVTNVTVLGAPSPKTESQARELAGLLAEDAAAIMRVASQNGNVTAKAIREVRERVTTKQAQVDVDEFPVLTHYAEQGKTADVVRLAGALREYDEPERLRRLETLAKTIAFEKRASTPADRHLSVAPEPNVPEDDYANLAYSVVGLANDIADVDVDATHLAFAITDDSLEHLENAIAFLSSLVNAVKEHY